MTRRSAELQMLSRNDCMALLATSLRGRLGLSVGALPVILPVSYLIDGDQIIVGAVHGAPFEAAADRTVVAFEAGDWDDRTSTGWSVLVQGTASCIDEAARHRVAQLNWEAERPQPVLHAAVSTDIVQGHRFVPGSEG